MRPAIGGEWLVPERDADPRDGLTGWERPAPLALCSCGRPVVVRGMCAYGLHGLHDTTDDREDFADEYAASARDEEDEL